MFSENRLACDTLVTADCVLTQDADRRTLDKGAVAIQGGRILAVGPVAEVEAAYVPTTRLDLGRRLLMPGLVNTHTHASMSIFRGYADDLPLMEWLTKHIWPAEKALTHEIVYHGALLACAEMMRSGTTTFCDMYLLENEVGAAVDDAGLRAVIGEGLFAFPSPAYEDIEEGYEVAKALRRAYLGHPRITTAIAPHAVYTTTPEILQKSYAMAEELGLIWKIHLAESPAESAESLARFGLRPVEYLHSLGLLTPRVLLAHGVDVTPDEIALLAETGVKVAHNPESNMKLASGMAPIPAMLDAGVTVGLGTDGAASNNNLNLFTEMLCAALMQKARLGDPTTMTAQTVLDMATRQGGVCLGLPDVGALEPGRRADLIALDLTEPNLQPLYAPVSHVVYAASGHEVDFTMVEGEVLYSDRTFRRFDYAALLDEIDAIRKWVMNRANGGPKT